MVGFLQSRESMTIKHSELERWIEKEGREVMRQLLQAHLDLRGPAAAVEAVRDADQCERPIQRLHERSLATVFGTVTVERFGYRSEGQESLHPVDGELNLPVERYSLELRRRVAEQAAKSSFEETQQALAATTGSAVPKRQVEELVVRAGNAEDFDQFYATLTPAEGPSGDLQVITSDGKGVVMRREDLREATKKAAERSRHKLGKRLSRGARNATASGWPRWLRCIILRPSCAPRSRSLARWRRCTRPNGHRDRGRSTSACGPAWRNPRSR
jgi:hypothetical protein